jgi:hypothetical protein
MIVVVDLRLKNKTIIFVAGKLTLAAAYGLL